MEYEIQKLPSSDNEESVGFRNIMEIFLASDCSEKESLIKNKLQYKNLTGLIFKDLKLSAFDFQHSSLNDVKFIRCNLTKANFDWCHLKNTFFDSSCEMKGVTIRGAITDVIRTETKAIDNKKEIDKYFYEKTQIPIEQKAPCQAVINLRKILEKVIRKGCGYNIPKKFLLLTKCSGGVPADKCVEACIAKKIVSETNGRLRIRINLFSDVERFVKNHELTSSIKEILDQICPDQAIGCQHVYE